MGEGVVPGGGEGARGRGRAREWEDGGELRPGAGRGARGGQEPRGIG